MVRVIMAGRPRPEVVSWWCPKEIFATTYLELCKAGDIYRQRLRFFARKVSDSRILRTNCILTPTSVFRLY
jgi:hypothetical protein